MSFMSNDKAIGQFKLQGANILRPYNYYGQQVFIEPTIELFLELALQLHARLNGVDIPIKIDEKKIKW